MLPLFEEHDRETPAAAVARRNWKAVARSALAFELHWGIGVTSAAEGLNAALKRQLTCFTRSNQIPTLHLRIQQHVLHTYKKLEGRLARERRTKLVWAEQNEMFRPIVRKVRLYALEATKAAAERAKASMMDILSADESEQAELKNKALALPCVLFVPRWKTEDRSDPAFNEPEADACPQDFERPTLDSVEDMCEQWVNHGIPCAHIMVAHFLRSDSDIDIDHCKLHLDLFHPQHQLHPTESSVKDVDPACLRGRKRKRPVWQNPEGDGAAADDDEQPVTIIAPKPLKRKTKAEEKSLLKPRPSASGRLPLRWGTGTELAERDRKRKERKKNMRERKSDAIEPKSQPRKKAAHKVSEPTKPRHCGKCGKTGHFSKVCPATVEEANAWDDVKRKRRSIREKEQRKAEREARRREKEAALAERGSKAGWLSDEEDDEDEARPPKRMRVESSDSDDDAEDERLVDAAKDFLLLSAADESGEDDDSHLSGEEAPGSDWWPGSITSSPAAASSRADRERRGQLSDTDDEDLPPVNGALIQKILDGKDTSAEKRTGRVTKRKAAGEKTPSSLNDGAKKKRSKISTLTEDTTRKAQAATLAREGQEEARDSTRPKHNKVPDRQAMQSDSDSDDIPEVDSARAQQKKKSRSVVEVVKAQTNIKRQRRQGPLSSDLERIWKEAGVVSKGKVDRANMGTLTR